MATELNYNDFVVVAHDEWKLECPKPDTTTKISAHLGRFEWNIAFVEQSELTLECVELKEGTHSGDVHVELFIYGLFGDVDSYELWLAHCDVHGDSVENPFRGILNNEDYSMARNFVNCSQLIDCNFEGSFALPQFVAVNVRILKDRALFHDFTVDRPIGILSNDQKLKVGEQVFHLNKQLLGLVSTFFHPLFNNPNFGEANQAVRDMGGGITDAALFHDFLLAIIPTSSKYDVLPNSQNLAGLMHLADYYGVDSLFGKFERSLKFCREMPITERIMLAKKYGRKEEFNVGGILHGVNDPEELRRICMALFNADD